MKQRFKIVLFIFISCLLSACTNEDFGMDNSDIAGNEPIPVLIAANKSVATRVKDNGIDFSENDRIGVFMIKYGALLSKQSISEGVDNIEFRCTHQFSRIGGHFEQVGETVYYPHDSNQGVDFIAYYPYKSLINDYIYPIDVSTQPEQKDSSNELDILYSNNMTNISKKRDTTMLTFDHMMARVELELWEDGQGGAYINSTEARITGLNRTAELNLAKGVIEELGSPGDIELTQPLPQVYRAFFIPQPAPNSRVYITTQSDGILVYEFPRNMVFEAGKYYKYSIIIKNKKQLEISQITISDWSGRNQDPIEDVVD